MSRLIDADALEDVKFHGTEDLTPVECATWQWGWNDAIDAIISNAPTVDPIKHGHWENKQIGEDISPYDAPCTIARCSVCRGKVFVFAEHYIVNYPYCPLCGAKMDEVEDGKN